MIIARIAENDLQSNNIATAMNILLKMLEPLEELTLAGSNVFVDGSTFIR
jgi:hypothetical protein